MSNRSGKGSAITTPSEVYKRWAVMVHRREGERHSTSTWLSAPPRADRSSGAVWSAPRSAPKAWETKAPEPSLEEGITECLARPEPPVAVAIPEPELEPEPVQVSLAQPAVPYESWTRAALYAKAKEIALSGRSSMTKGMLAQKLWALTA